MDNKTVLALSWRDVRSPKSGGAEVHTYNLMKCLKEQNYKFISFAPHYDGVLDNEVDENITYIRKGNIITVIFHAFCYYRKNRKTIDYVINQCNTHNFFTRLWVPKRKRIFYIHQLTREIWDINAGFPLNIIGKTLENFSLRLNRHDYTITVSESTKQELVELGFDPNKIYLAYNAVDPEIIKDKVDDNKVSNRDFIYVGRYSKYKGIDASIEALGMVHEKYPDAKLRIVGKEDQAFIDEIIVPISKKYNLTIGNNDNCDIIICGFVSEDEKLRLMEKSKALLFPSIREGWGIIVSEAAARGTPSIVYNSPGARDAVNFGRAGYLCNHNSVDDIYQLMLSTLQDAQLYKQKQEEALEYVKKFNWKNNEEAFIKMIAKMGD
ncbi:glycosyltransferase family 4 protein [Butyrivibrio fibrisolvens]|uniref:glycosyltransferase family 4 protein n=1 Tax=Butyrivibrio fibrisolvens TaxID=831 RepID=UPI0004003CC8|nr:glycosyltransferase family 4 protein [Butyrivibrio fibrisolvens]